jgi:hypothetical protein
MLVIRRFSRIENLGKEGTSQIKNWLHGPSVRKVDSGIFAGKEKLKKMYGNKASSLFKQ